MTALVPLQYFPPYAGSGLAHSLVLVCIPPTVLVQILHLLHSVQLPVMNMSLVFVLHFVVLVRVFIFSYVCKFWLVLGCEFFSYQ